ncbi:MAG: cation:dicarboxylase symporter family transporter [Synergistaceae bacterium]|nr:cation:dicarboxylase symporter family transporter [Synergistaceae bacterium]
MKLTNENIAAAVDEIQNFFEKLNVSRQDKIKICLLFEESLLRCKEKFGENHDFELVKRKWFGTPKVMIKILGEPYNPVTDNDEKNIFSEIVMKNFLNYERTQVIYRYESGCNEISGFSAQKSQKIKIPGGSLAVAVFLAIISAWIMQNFPEPTQKIIAENFVTPILSKLFGAIIAVSIPLIFISIVSSICAIENISALHNLTTKVFKRFLWILLFAVISSVIISDIFFPVLNFDFSGQISLNNFGEMQKIFDLILSIIPQNIVEPFLQGKILQIVILALLTGICITILGERVQDIKNLVFSLQKIVIEMVSIVFKIIPATIFLCIVKTILQNSMSEILNVWKVVLAQYVIYIFLCLVMLLKNYFLYGVNISDFLKKIYPAALISFITGSVSIVMQKNIEICSQALGIKKSLCDFYIPLSNSLCPTLRMVSFIVYSFFAAQFSGASITMSQLFIIIFFSMQFTIAAGNEGGGGFMALMGLLLVQVGFSFDAVGEIMTANIFVSNFAAFISLIMRDCDLLAFSHSLKQISP